MNLAPFTTGTVLFGKYRIERLLGQGGFSEVYLATHLHLQAPRALKVLTKGGRITTGVLNRVARRFQLEAQLGARLAHAPHIVRVHDFEWDREQGLLVLVMEYMPGGSLKDRIRQAREQGLPGLPVDEVVRTAYHAALGLAALHRAGLVHRDIKPSNILYDAQGRAKIADLGVVQMPHGVTRRTELGETAPRHPGTPEYMSPEQERTVGYLPPASDIYSLGVTLFEALTLRPYKHLRPGTRVSEVRPDVPQWLDDLIARMLAKDPEARPWDGGELARLLQPYVEEGAPAEPEPTQDTWEETERTVTVTEAVLDEDEGLASEAFPTPAEARMDRQKRSRGMKAPRKKSGAFRPVASGRASRTSRFGWRRGIALGVVVGLLAVLVLLLGLGGRLTARPEERTTPSLSAAGTTTVSPTFTPTITPSPTPFVGPVLMGTPLPQDLLQPITPANADRVQALARWGKGWITEVAWSPDGRWLAVATSLGVYLYDVETWTETRLLEHPASVHSVAFSPDGEMLASGSDDGTVRLWRVADGTLLYTLDLGLEDIEFEVSMAFSPDGALLALGSQNGMVRLWRVADGVLLYTLKGHTDWVSSVAFSPDGKILASGSQDMTVRLWRVADGALLHILTPMKIVLEVAFSPNGQLLASGAVDGTVELWRVADGTLLRTLEKGHTAEVTTLAFSPNGTLLASSARDGEIRLWRVDKGTLLRTLEGHTSGVESVAFSPDGKMLASRAWDETVRLWRVADGTLLRTLEGYTGVESVAFSPDGKMLASGSWDNTVRLWRVADGTLLRTLEGHTDRVWSVAFSPDGKMLASGSGDNTVRLWRVADGTLLRTLEGHRGGVWSVAFSSDGEILASGSIDNTVRLWRVADGVLLHILEGHTWVVTSLAFSPDGDLLASGSEDGTVRLWGVVGP